MHFLIKLYRATYQTNRNFIRISNMLTKRFFKVPSWIYTQTRLKTINFYWSLEKRSRQILSSLVPINRAQILYKTVKKTYCNVTFAWSCHELVMVVRINVRISYWLKMTAPFCRYLKKALLRLLHFAVSVYVLLLLLLDPRSILNDDFEGTLNMVSK